MKKTYFIPCAPCSYISKERLERQQPGLEKIPCPRCSQDMWISEKKRKLVKQFGIENLGCYSCIEEDLKKAKETGFDMVKI